LKVQHLDKEEREKFDQMLADASRSAEPKTLDKSGKRMPSWWPSEEAITRDNLEAARAMGYAIGQVG